MKIEYRYYTIRIKGPEDTEWERYRSSTSLMEMERIMAGSKGCMSDKVQWKIVGHN